MKFADIHLPTDFSKGGHRAFDHALKLALNGCCSLRLFHVGTEDTPPWSDFPGVRRTLEKWGVLPEGSSKEQVTELGVTPNKYFVRTDQPVKAILHDLKKEQPDLVVMGTHARTGLSRLLHTSVCKEVTREGHRPTLIVPHSTPGFVDENTGECSLDRILVPVSPEVRPGKAAELTRRLIHTVAREQVRVRLFYVGRPEDAPALDLPADDLIAWESTHREGEVLKELAAEVDNYAPDVVVMLSRGRDTVFNMLMPDKLEKAVSWAACPILTQNIAG